MKRTIYNIIIWGCAALLLFACNADRLDAPGAEWAYESNRIILNVSTGGQPVQRAVTEVGASGVELAVSHLDVLIFENDADNKNNSPIAYYERIDVGSDNGSGIVALEADRNKTFTADTEYWVYLVANAKATKADFEADIHTFSDLLAMTQTDERIHVTGLNVTNAPQTFLMDGVAYLKNTNGPSGTSLEPPTPAPLVLNNGNPSENTELDVKLRRAAAKIEITILKKTGEDADSRLGNFALEAPTNPPGYYFNKLPYSTALIAEGEHLEPELRISQKVLNNYSQWNTTSVQITAYAYSFDWENEPLNKQVRVIVNLPMRYDDDGNAENGAEKLLENNYYQIPISKAREFKRNNLYRVTVTVNTIGSDHMLQPVTLENIDYETYPWEPVNVNVGGETDKPSFLYVNEEEMEMYNMTNDSTTLSFNSSSAVSVEVVNYWYEDKFGQLKFRYAVQTDKDGNLVEDADGHYITQYNDAGEKTPINDDLFTGKVGDITTEEQKTIDKTMAGTFTYRGSTYYYWDEYWGDSSKDNWLKNQGVPDDELNAARNALNNGESYTFTKKTITDEVGELINITATPDAGLKGKIKINSPIPTNNTIRYIELEVRNDNGTPGNKSDDVTRRVIIKQYPLEYITNIQGWFSYREDFGSHYQKKGDRNVATDTYTASTDHWTFATSYKGNFFDAMVATQSDDGSSTFRTYYWPSDGSGATANSTGSNTNSVNLSNARIYHVRITASSSAYTLGKPRVINGRTDGGEDNAKLVSPSFMIASQLGAVYSGAFSNLSDDQRVTMAAGHCKNYVEVYKNGSTNSDTVHLRGWRLPTKAELRIINRFQRTTASAIDKVLGGSTYYSASGPLDISAEDLSGYDNIVNAGYGYYQSANAIRCIRDAYEDKK